MNKKNMFLIYICIWICMGFLNYFFWGGNTATFEENNSIERFSTLGCVLFSFEVGFIETIAMLPVLIIIGHKLKKNKVSDQVDHYSESHIKITKYENSVNRKSLALTFSYIWIGTGIISYFYYWNTTGINDDWLSETLGNLMYSSLTGLVVTIVLSPVLLPVILHIGDWLKRDVPHN